MRVASLWAGLLLVLLSSLVAPGTMPTRAEDGTLVLVLCTGDGVTATPFDPLTMEPVSNREGEGEEEPHPGYCPWAASQAWGGSVPVTSVVVPLLLLAGHAAAPASETVLAVSRVTGLPPSTGPPSAV